MATIPFTFRWPWVEIPAEFESLVRPYFTANKPVFRNRGTEGFEWAEREVYLLRRRRNLLRGPAGLGYAACDQLQEQGQTIEPIRCESGYPLQGPPQQHHRLHDGEKEVLICLGHWPLARICVPSLQQAVPLIASAADTASERRIVMVAANQVGVDELSPRLQQAMRRRLFTHYYEWTDEVACFLCTPMRFQSVGLHDFDVIFVLGLDAALQRNVRSTVQGHLRRLVRRAFIESNRSVAEFDEFRLTAQYGPPHWPIAYGRQAHPRVHVLTAPVPNASTPNSGDALQQKLLHVWHNEARHRRILRIAQGLQAKNYGELRSLLTPGHRLPESLEEVQFDNILILAASNEHRASILKCLGDAVAQASNPVRQADYFDKPVVSTVAQARSGIGNASVVIRADATGEQWPSNTRSLVSRYKRVPLLVVDLQDSYDERSIDDANLRINNYVRLGWAIGGGHHNDAEP